MTRNKLYRTRVSLSKQTAQVKSGACNCKAGANGRCKHIGALLYKILDFTESEVDEIPQELYVSEKGLIIDRKNPLLAASIDGEVYDPTAKHSPVGNLEMKYKQFPSRLCTEQKN
ncbi:unnamed protein product [Porites lobata]|uniref:SWIM-type domain-containing protein n=1 Tax=Porites lobata TaxID=104759 RepID=A0ABN8RIJ4_9CNID|nr:unnamed protein product [Porites lobata]